MKLLDFEPGELRLKLDKYIAADQRYAKVFEQTKIAFDAAANLTAHNWDHAYRDTLNAIVIGEAEGADMSIVLPAITMHDIGFLYGATGKTHGEVGAEKLLEFLCGADVKYSDEMIQKIAECIRTHKGSTHGHTPESLEARVVADADLLEKFGPFGVYQHIRTFTEFNMSITEVFKRRDEILGFTLQTKTGMRLADAGRQFTSNFYSELVEANQPYEDLA